MLLVHKRCRIIGMALLFMVAFQNVIIIASSIGPSRVYIPLLFMLVVTGGGAAGCMVDYINSRYRYAGTGLMAALILFVAAMAPGESVGYKPVDWKKMFKKIATDIPVDVYVCYSAVDGLPIRHNNMPDAVIDNLKRIPRKAGEMILFTGKAKLEGVCLNDGNKSKTVELPDSVVCRQGRFETLNYNKVRIKPVGDKTDPNSILIAAIPPTDGKRYFLLQALLLAKEGKKRWYVMNNFLKNNSVRIKGKMVQGGLFFTTNCQYSVNQLKLFEKKLNNRIKFFELVQKAETGK